MSSQTEHIWNVCHEPLKQFIHKRVSDQDRVDDILQDVFIKIHTKIDTLKDNSKISSWIYQVTRNTIIDYYRSHKNLLKYVDDIESMPVLDDEDDISIPMQEMADGLINVVKTLPEKYAEALIAVDFNGHSQKSLSEKLGISRSGARSRVQRARQMLKDNLMRCCHFEFDKYGTIIDSHPIACCCCDQYHHAHHEK